jgi:hypothetical protein
VPVSPPSNPIFDTATSIMNATKPRVAQEMPSLVAYSGSVLDHTQATSQQFFNNAWRNFQDSLCDAGSKAFQEEIVIKDIPPTASFDPADQNSISWFECSDGVNTTSTPVLPSDLVTPLWMSERQAGTENPFPRPDAPNMDLYIDGLPRTAQKYCYNGCWEWRGQVIYYPGATQSVDFLIRYRKQLSDIVDVGNQRWFNQPVPLVRCQNPMSWWMVVEIAAFAAGTPNAPRNIVAMAATAEAKAIEATKKYANRDVMLDERTEAIRVPYNGGSRGQGSQGGYGNFY